MSFVKSTIGIQNSVLSDVINCQYLLFNQILSHRYIKSLFVEQVIEGKKVELSIKFNSLINSFFFWKSSIFLYVMPTILSRMID